RRRTTSPLPLATRRSSDLPRPIGASNLTPEHLQPGMDAGVVPDVNQIRLDPRNPRRREAAFHAEHGILTESYTPIGRRNDLLAEEVITQIGQDVQGTVARVVRRWHGWYGGVAVPMA